MRTPRASRTRKIALEIRTESSGKDSSGCLRASEKSSSASSRASERSFSSTSSTYLGLILTNSSAESTIEATISRDEQQTPHLLADESLTTGSLVASKRAWRASAVRKRLAPSTMSLVFGEPSGSSISRQLDELIVAGRPPAGTKASATTR
eukprot:2953035-Pleurochrysis_carterae.AAC.6